MRPMSARESRLVAILMLVAVATAVLMGIVAPFLAGFADRATARADLVDRYAANDRTVAAVPRLTRTAAAQQRALADFVLVAPDAATADERLRERLEAAIAAVGGDVRGAEDGIAGPGMATTRIVARLDERQLTTALARLQNDAPWLVIGGVDIAANDALLSGHAAPLDVTIAAQIAWRPAHAR